MPFTSTKDTEFGDCYFDISKTDKRLNRATLKTYERTGTYVFLKLFKKATDDYEFEQRISLTLGEFENLVSSASKIQNSVADQLSTTKPPLAKKPKNSKRSCQQRWLRRCLSVLQINLNNFRNSSNFSFLKKNLAFLLEIFMQCVHILIPNFAI